MLTALTHCTSKWKSFQMFGSNSVLLSGGKTYQPTLVVVDIGD